MFPTMDPAVALTTDSKKLDKPFPYFRKPNIVGSFSIDGERRLKNDRHQMKFLHEKLLRGKLQVFSPKNIICILHRNDQITFLSLQIQSLSPSPTNAFSWTWISAWRMWKGSSSRQETRKLTVCLNGFCSTKKFSKCKAHQRKALPMTVAAVGAEMTLRRQVIPHPLP